MDDRTDGAESAPEPSTAPAVSEDARAGTSSMEMDPEPPLGVSEGRETGDELAQDTDRPT